METGKMSLEQEVELICANMKIACKRKSESIPYRK